jgi:hypothetical protein
LLFYLIYLSQSKKLMQESDLLCILDQSKILNHGNRITGMLLYLEGKFLSQVEGRFMQVLEGREEDVISTLLSWSNQPFLRETLKPGAWGLSQWNWKTAKYFPGILA